ncbi:DUF1553 domain-containing protein [Flexithrix dorotheae]|uniref:DUF1553 domain-containing protein n=1 Tax=Flexithrix dorotheae TaxID=70993 RepID=UPI00036F94DF|nr:DUF1553 domain-containing protein [Flexithrix dorotheae]
MPPFTRILVFFIVLYLVSCNTPKPDEIVAIEKELPEKVDFNLHIKPILSDRCFACHGPDKANQKGDLRLDTPEGAFAALGDELNRHAIVPKKIGKSEVFKRIISEDPELVMPPTESNLTLSLEEKALIIKWIEQGAEYKPHWSFIPAEKKEIPKVKNEDWVKNEIDHFVLRKIEKKDWKVAEKASKETLIRRASFDITGLPPTLEEINQFLEDDSPDAFEKVVERLLASSSYGERMAAEWMDIARFTDSDGYLDDKHRDFSPWRDWVIKSFNENMPYNQFISWQIAGDLMPNATQAQIMATAFNRLHKKNSEAGIDFEEFRVEYVADRTNTLGAAFLGLTMECARCHDHKYDPISQEDYYKLFSFFNSTNELGTAIYGPDQTPGPSLMLTSEEQEKQIAFLNKLISEKEAHLQTTKENLRKNLNEEYDIERVKKSLKTGLLAHYPFDKFQEKGNNLISPNTVSATRPATLSEAIIKEGKFGKGIYVGDYNRVTLDKKIGWYERTDPFSISLWLYPDTLYKDVSVFHHNEDYRLGTKGYLMQLKENKICFTMSHSWPHNAIEIITEKPLPIKTWTQVTMTYDGSSNAEGLSLYFNGEKQPVDIRLNNLYKTILYEYNIHTYGFAGFQLAARSKYTPFKNGGIDDLKIFRKELSSLEVLYNFDANSIAKLDKNTLAGYWADFNVNNDPQIQRINKGIKKIRDEENEYLKQISEIMVMGDLPEPRNTYILNRGDYRAHGKEVKPGTPKNILPFDEENYPANRLGLARWLTDSKNPLTARVVVNRVWQQYFGKGLVKTSDDFGNQGDLPTHPDLLDWLTVDFIESGWDLKALQKKIVLSATYQQSSKTTPKMLELDPDNVMLARGSRFRLSAEAIRDNALAISGLLVDKIGGQSVYPYQPEGLWDELSNKSWRYKYLQEPGEGLYRRSLYTVWKRTSPPPGMLIFDAPERSVCTVKRQNTSTPIQALVLQNDPQYQEASRFIAQRMLLEGREDPLSFGFQLITGRKPMEKETRLILQLYDKELENFENHPEKADKYLNIGESDYRKELPKPQLAALAVVANTILNTSEGYTRN